MFSPQFKRRYPVMNENSKMNIAICDDAPKELEKLVSMVSEYLDINNYLVSLDTYSSGEEFLRGDVDKYQLVIFDIFMGELNGIETAKKLIEEHPLCKIIFCSTSNAYAAESYDVNALRYINKPVEKEKLFGTLDKFFHIYTSMKTITVKQNRMDESIYINEIIWVEADGHKCIIHTRRDDIVTRTPFSQICESLEGSGFVKPIRYAFVSLKYVETLPTDVLSLKGGDVVPISRDKRAEIKKAFSEYKMKEMLRGGGAV